MNPTPDQIKAALTKKVRELKAESHNAVNVYKIKEVLQGLLDVVEVLLTGRATIVQPNVVPGLPLQSDPTKQHVQLFRTPDQEAVAGGLDGQRAPGEGGAPDLDHGGQRVEFLPAPSGPPQAPVTNADGEAGRLVPGIPTRSVEAGRGEEVPPVPGAPQSREELLARLPIPVLEG